MKTELKYFPYLCRFIHNEATEFIEVKMSEKSSSKSRVAGSYFMSLMSISLVLFLLGVFALLMMHAQKLSNHLKENIGFEVVMNSNVKEANILKLQQELDSMPAVKSTEYITKDEAIRRLSEDLGEDFLQWLGNEENPLLPSIDVRFNADWANNDSINLIQAQLKKNKDVKEIYYQKSLVNLINQNVNRIGLALMIASLVLLIISITLIRNTIRLALSCAEHATCGGNTRLHPSAFHQEWHHPGLFRGFTGRCFLGFAAIRSHQTLTGTDFCTRL